MCIMECREGQHHSTIAQACAHNVGTVIGDLTMFERVLSKAGHGDEAWEAGKLRSQLEGVYDASLRMYSGLLSQGIVASMSVLDLPSTDLFSPTLVRDVVEICVERDMHRARTYETRREPTVYEHGHTHGYD